MGTNKQTLAKTPPSNITEPNALRVENQICLHLKKKKKNLQTNSFSYDFYNSPTDINN
jgi:hypothetical protein